MAFASVPHPRVAYFAIFAQALLKRLAHQESFQKPREIIEYINPAAYFVIIAYLGFCFFFILTTIQCNLDDSFDPFRRFK